jgi:hypothetical protein
MLKRIPLYPLLISIFPILSLTSYNIHEIFLSAMIRPLFASLLVGVIVYVLAYLVTKDIHRAALISSILLLFFFAYGHLYDALEDVTVSGLALFRHRTLVPVLGLILLGIIFLAGRYRNPVAITYAANLISIVLLIIPLFTIGTFLTRQSIANRTDRNTLAASPSLLNEKAPDIYYIILDAYGRQDVLREKYGFDNRPFINALRERGFYVGDCSQSNYGFTEYSLSSSLNYDYLDVLGGTDNNARIALIKHGAVRSFFERLGYQIIAFPTGWASTEWKDADVFYDYGGGLTTLSEFEKLFMDTTLLRVLSDYTVSNLNDADNRDARRMRVLSALDKLKSIPDKPGHKFTFAHLVIPHPPYSFGSNGEAISFNDGAPIEEREKAYTNQVLFINQEILKVVDVILRKSKTRPVIVIQGDHGPLPDLAFSGQEKMPILNAYYLPGAQAQKKLYPTITPVNTFRVILNFYFGQDLPLLKDVSYYAPKGNHDAFEIIPNTCQSQP